MTDDEQIKAFEARMTSLLVRITDAQKFAEAKNAALLAFSSAWTAATLNLLSGDRSLPTGMPIALNISLVMFVAACLISIWSFLPKRNIFNFHRDPSQDKNLLFFGDIAKFDPAAYQQRARERYMPSDAPPVAQSYMDDLVIQISVNSKIADRKFSKFNAGAMTVFVALTVLATPIGFDLIQVVLAGWGVAL